MRRSETDPWRCRVRVHRPGAECRRNVANPEQLAQRVAADTRRAGRLQTGRWRPLDFQSRQESAKKLRNRASELMQTEIHRRDQSLAAGPETHLQPWAEPALAALLPPYSLLPCSPFAIRHSRNSIDQSAANGNLHGSPTAWPPDFRPTAVLPAVGSDGTPRFLVVYLPRAALRGMRAPDSFALRKLEGMSWHARPAGPEWIGANF